MHKTSACISLTFITVVMSSSKLFLEGPYPANSKSKFLQCKCQYHRLRFYKSEKTDVLGVWDTANYQPFSAKILAGNAETQKTPKHQNTKKVIRDHECPSHCLSCGVIPLLGATSTRSQAAAWLLEPQLLRKAHIFPFDNFGPKYGRVTRKLATYSHLQGCCTIFIETNLKPTLF